jgi:5-methylcytosine-specific restriction endonuclease McrA
MTKRERYHDYLESPYWKEVAKAVKERAGYRCQVCNSANQLTAHHRTYMNKGNEMEHLDDLTCLCWPCHSLFHEKSKITRPEHKKRRRKRNPRFQMEAMNDHLDRP